MRLNYKDYCILYVDDEPANLTAFSYCFEDEFTVLTASSGADALGLMGGHEVAVLLTDQRMPNMTGAELCMQVREAWPDTVRMVVTAYADISAAVASINSGQVSRYILKPWREDELSELLRNAVEAFHLGKLLKSLQVRLLQSEQQAGAHLMLSRVLHELSNPASALGGNVNFIADSAQALMQMLKTGRGDAIALAQELHLAAQDALEAYRSLEGRIDHFRSGDSPPPERPPGTDLKRAAISAVGIVRTELRKRARINVTLEDVPLVAINATHAGQILVNLLMNAGEAMEEGAPEQNMVEVKLQEVDGKAVLSVSDTGKGVPEDLLPRIFEPFVSTKQMAGGHGLGLAIVKDLVEAAGGVVRVENASGKGTTFVVELPASP